MEKEYDYIIIGSGAGGGTLAHKLANYSSKKILILERGDFLPREKQNWDPEEVFGKGRYHAKETWLDKEGNDIHPGIHYFVGGNTKVYGAALLRMREKDFGKVVHEGGISPAWPLQYEDFRKYYDEAESLYRVHGLRGEDPLEPPSDKPYTDPPISHEPKIKEIFDNLKKIGLHPFHLPLGIQMNEATPFRSRCIRCNTCDGFPCLTHAKSDAEVVAIRPIMDFPHVTLLTGSKVEKLHTDSSGKRVTSVEVVHEGEKKLFKGSTVIVSCGAINSSLLLLASKNDKHPNGLANSSGVVGRHYMCHNNSAFIALSFEKNPTVFQKTIGLNDFYYGSDDYPHPMGHIQMLGKSMGPMFKADAPRITPEIALDEMAEHAIDFWLTTEDLPDPNNRVIYKEGEKLQLHYTPNNLKSHNALIEKLKSLLREIGCHPTLIPRGLYTSKKIPLDGCAHQVGTVRFGDDPKTAALDRNCKAHDLENLYVVDGSFFCSSSSVNPGLTIMANALRVAEHLLKLP